MLTYASKLEKFAVAGVLTARKSSAHGVSKFLITLAETIHDRRSVIRKRWSVGVEHSDDTGL